MVSCGGRKPLEPERITETKTIREVKRDTVIQVKADSTFYQAFIECVNGKAVLREPKNNKDQNPKTQTESKIGLQKPIVTLDENGNLNVECRKEVEEVKAQLTNYYQELLREHQKPVYIEKPFKWYDVALMWLGGIFLICLATLAAILIIKK